ncbi:hypothetical protein FVA74_12395 [Salinibacterium sp. dk2585]|uniref:hypothetical protein n=1 Tax=unclassified Salinibacterium TaxID=2632331 RepID=UPI0011C25253|nr:MULTISPECIES: hypothetical protein [unclassified Salinibacterium]QEE62286.1 hypothetical protein FVA74_12395 [Salinibacterium sp. dk2585]TXK53637.1 hypothetical protein FVP63_10665 [Salinibacterium sp. dk5596]
MTSLERTVVDVASAPHFARAVVMADAAFQTPVRHPLRRKHYPDGLQLPAVRAVLESLLPFPGSARAGRVLEFSNGCAGSPLESQFRVQCLALGAPIPELQVAFRDEDGFIGFADAYWREHDAAVEIDGRAKYGADRQFQQDLAPEEILWREKLRGDRLSRVVRRFDRLTREDILDRRRLAGRLHRLGVMRRA